MKIDLVSEHADPMAAIGGADAGGQNVHVAALAAALAARGHDVAVHTRRNSPAQRPTALAPGAVLEYVDAGPAVPLDKDELAPHMPAFAVRLAERWAARRPDVVHAHFWMSGLAALTAADGVPVVQTFHALGAVKRRWQGQADASPPGRIAAEREIGRRARLVLATCTDEVHELRALGVPEERVEIVPCGVDVDTFRPDGPVAQRPAGRHRVLSIGRLVPRKGVDTLVRAVRDLPDVEVIIAGGSPDDEEAVRLRHLAGAYGLSDRVRVVGSVARAQVPALMRSADVVVSVPWYEPFGMVPLEAMACGVPVIATAVGGHLDTVAGCGVLVPPRRPEALTRALRDLLDHPARRASIAAASARRAHGEYGWQRIAERTEAHYTRVVAGRFAPTGADLRA